jgi:uncharacterized SAM-binding protein YcdF (DUF218 family)
MPHAEPVAIVVLGCRVRPDGRPGPALARRAAMAARAHREGVAARVVVCGGRRWGAHIEARALADELERLGVPRAAIVEELWSLSTHENAIGASALVRGLAGREGAAVVVVSCAWHLARAVADFRAVGLDPRPLAAEGPPASPIVRAWRWGHEVVCVRLDRASLARGGWLRAGARWAVGVGASAERATSAVGR